MSSEAPAIETPVVSEDTMLGVFTRVAYRVFYAIVGVIVVMVLASFGLGAYLTDLRSEIHAVKIGQAVQTVQLKEMNVELKATQLLIARGILPEAERRFEPLEQKAHDHP